MWLRATGTLKSAKMKPICGNYFKWCLHIKNQFVSQSCVNLMTQCYQVGATHPGIPLTEGPPEPGGLSNYSLRKLIARMSDLRQKSQRSLRKKKCVRECVYACEREREREKESARASLSLTRKVRRIIPVLKFCGERSQGPLCWVWTRLLSFLSFFLLLLSLFYVQTPYLYEKLALILMESF